MSTAVGTVRSESRVIERQPVRVGLFYGFMLPLLAVGVIAGIGVGSLHIPNETILRVLGAKLFPGLVAPSSISQTDIIVVWLIRVPRVVVAAAVGAGLATAGAVMQGLFRNPLAEPGLTGAGAGAVLGAVVAFVAGWSAHSVVWLPMSAVVGALVALVLVYAMATRGGVTPVGTLLLAGIAVSSLLSALSSLLLSLKIVDWQVAQEIIFWMMGGLDSRTWTHVWLCAPFVLIGIIAALSQARDLDLMQQGEETAMSLGVNIESSKRILTLTAALLTGAAIAVAGMIGFVGLIVPHAVRLVVGPSNRTLLPASALAGAAFMILCDIVARTAHPPTEIRLGVVTAICGAPFFIVLLLRWSSERVSR